MPKKTLNNHFHLSLLECTMKGPIFLAVLRLAENSHGLGFLVRKTKGERHRTLYDINKFQNLISEIYDEYSIFRNSKGKVPNFHLQVPI